VLGADWKTAFGLLGFNVCGWHNLSMGGYDVRLDACSGCMDWVNGVDLELVSPSTRKPWCDHSKMQFMSQSARCPFFKTYNC